VGVCVWEVETSKWRGLKPEWGCCVTGRKIETRTLCGELA
jgi:hypothetical protein